MNIPPEKQILNFIQSYITKHGYSPSVSEINDGIGYKSKGSTYHYIKRLIDKELLTNDGSKRGLKIIVEEPFQPYMGTIVAGGPLEAIPEPERINFLDKFNIPGLYWLKVSEEVGDSMIEEKIFPGDFVGVRPAKSAKNNSIVVALIDKTDTTLKTLYQCKDYIELRPANKNYKSRRFDHDRIEIQAVLKTVVSFR